MIIQHWVNSCNDEMMVIDRYNEATFSDCGCLFLPGLGQNKAGLYFLYTMIAEQISQHIPVIQMDYRGFGDSTGNLSDCSMASILDDVKECVRYFKEKYGIGKLIVVSSGFANGIALDFAINHTEIDCEMVLIKPFLLGTLYDRYVDEINMEYVNNNKFLDTADVIDWDSSEALFKWLGAGRNRTKGLYINRDFFMDTVRYSLIDKFKEISGRSLIITDFGNKELGTALENNHNIEWFFSNKEDPNVVSMVERKSVINRIVEWILNGKNTK